MLEVAHTVLSRTGHSHNHVGASKVGHFPHVTSSTTTDPKSERQGSTSRWFRSSDGRLTLWQPPNPALCVWLVTLVLGWLSPSAAEAAAVDGIRH